MDTTQKQSQVYLFRKCNECSVGAQGPVYRVLKMPGREAEQYLLYRPTKVVDESALICILRRLRCTREVRCGPVRYGSAVL